MDRRIALKSLAALGSALAGSGWAARAAAQRAGTHAPPGGDLNVAFLLSDGAQVIDFCGPWEVFQDVFFGGPHGSPGHRMPFRLYTVAERLDPIRASGGMTIVPSYTLDDAPAPQVVVIPAQSGHSQHLQDWIVGAHDAADVTMSVCTGAFLLASTGLLDGKSATTHHDYYDRFASSFPDVDLRRGVRFVEHDKLLTAGGLSSGIDGALRVVERYFGREIAASTARYMEYEGTGWMI